MNWSKSELDARLTADARRQHALLAQQVRPVGHYPPRPAVVSAAGQPSADHGMGWGGWLWAVTVGGVAAAGVLLAVLLVRPGMPGDTPGQTVAQVPPPAPGGDSPQERWEALLDALATPGRAADQTLAAWDQVSQPAPLLNAAWRQSEQIIAQPMRAEFAALETDLRTVAGYVRRQWAQPGGADDQSRQKAVEAPLDA